MNAKLFAIALIAAVAYASTLIAMEEYEKSGGIVPPEVTAEILYGARIYTDVCADRTGPLLEEIE